MNQDGPSLIIEPPPPPPPPPGPPYSHRYAYVSSVMRSSWHFSSSGFNIRFPRTPQNENKNLNFFSSDYFHILHIVELWCDFKKFVGPWSIYIFIKCLWVLLTNVFWFRATGGYICGCGRPSNLVWSSFVHIYNVHINGHLINNSHRRMSRNSGAGQYSL